MFIFCSSSVAVPKTSADNPSLPILVSVAFSSATFNRELHTLIRAQSQSQWNGGWEMVLVGILCATGGKMNIFCHLQIHENLLPPPASNVTCSSYSSYFCFTPLLSSPSRPINLSYNTTDIFLPLSLSQSLNAFVPFWCSLLSRLSIVEQHKIQRVTVSLALSPGQWALEFDYCS